MAIHSPPLLIDRQRFAQIPWKVGIDATGDAHVVRDKLNQDRSQNRNGKVVSLGQDEVVMDVLAQGLVLDGDGDGMAAADGDLVDVADHHRLVAGGGVKDDRVAVVGGGQGAVLELAAEHALTVGVGDLFELQRAFQGDGMSQAESKVVWDAID